MGLSIISSPAGMMPTAMMAATASPALRMSSKLAMMQRASCGIGTSLTVTSVVTASMPSEPMTMLIKSNPAASSASEPNSSASPAIVKPLILSTLCRVSPYFRQCTPPEFSATLPAMVQAIWLDGSGA